MSEQIAFGAIAALMVFAGLMVVTGRDLVRCVLWLAVMLLGTAALFVLLEAPFLAGAQVLLYTGGVITLMLFGVMLTRRHQRLHIENEQTNHVPGATAAAVFFGLIATAIMKTDFPAGAGALPASTQDLGAAFLTEHLLAFEVLSLLLLAAMVGAIVLARRRDHVEPGRDAERGAGASGAAREAPASDDEAARGPAREEAA